MARVTNMKPPCGYNAEGIDEVKILDFEDFKGYKFFDDNLYNNCKVIAIYKTGTFTEIEAPDTAKYGSTIAGAIYSHVLETFVSALNADLLANLHLGTKRRFVVVFRAKNGKYFTFGYEAGAVLTYSAQTPESLGALVTLTAVSTYPLFETEAEALTALPASEFLPDFNNSAYCEIT